MDQSDSLGSLVYTSVASTPFTDEALEQLVAQSRRNNARAGLTGLLLHRRGRFVQALEGPPAKLRERMAVIEADPRHASVQFLVEEAPGRRRFPDWTMEYEPFSPVIAASIPGYETVFAQLDAQADAASIPALHETLRWFRARAAQSW